MSEKIVQLNEEVIKGQLKELVRRPASMHCRTISINTFENSWLSFHFRIRVLLKVE